MAVCAVIDLNTNQLINTIISEPTDLAPDNCKLVEIPDGHYWDSNTQQVLPVPTNTGE